MTRIVTALAGFGCLMTLCVSPAFALQQIAAGKHASRATVVEANHPVPGHLLFESIEFNSDGSLYVKGPRVHYQGQLRKLALEKDNQDPAAPYESAGYATMANEEYVCNDLGYFAVKDPTHMQSSKVADPSQLVVANFDQVQPSLNLVDPTGEVNNKRFYHYVALEGINCRRMTSMEACMVDNRGDPFASASCAAR